MSALSFFQYYTFSIYKLYLFTEIDVKMRHEITQDLFTGVELVAICLIDVKR